MTGPRLHVSGLNKSYRTPVLRDFDLELHPGEVHALMGSNGAGKSTLARILCGLTLPDSGRFLIDQLPYAPTSRAAAAQHGVVMVMQELNIVPTLSVAENLFFDRLPTRRGFIDRERLHTLARGALAHVGLQHLDPTIPAGQLGIGEQQLVEIAATLALDCRVLILDEPTAALTATETEVLFEQINQLTSAGVAVLYVSHRMEEITRIADRTTVMRDGRRIATHARGAATATQIIQEMAGHSVSNTPPLSHARTTARPALELRQLHAPPRVHDFNLVLRPGEVVGLAGLVGSGRTETLRAIYGADRVSAGEILIHGRSQHFKHPHDAVRCGIGMVPEDRKSQALLLPQGLRVNATLASTDRFARRGFLSPFNEYNEVNREAESLAIKHDDPDMPVEQLSGGNQQKVVLLRWLLRRSTILLLDEPTRGVDVAAKEKIYQQLRAFAARGGAILMAASELSELTTLCDRILVLAHGRTTGEFTPDTWSDETITRAAFAAPVPAS